MFTRFIKSRNNKNKNISFKMVNKNETVTGYESVLISIRNTEALNNSLSVIQIDKAEFLSKMIEILQDEGYTVA